MGVPTKPADRTLGKKDEKGFSVVHIEKKVTKEYDIGVRLPEVFRRWFDKRERQNKPQKN